jgi:2-hydroxychromene-2-carboxylate isomerase
MRHDRPVAATSPAFYFGAMSPYSWFSAERMDRLIPTAGWHAVFLGGVFNSNGRTSWALGERRAAGMADCEARAGEYGLGPIRWPQPWPTNDLLIARGMVAAQARGLMKPFALAAMRLAFLESADLAETPSVLEAGSRTGIDAGEMEAALADSEVKDALRAATEEAMARGLFGVPTVIVGEELFWGDDRLAEAAAAAAGAATA